MEPLPSFLHSVVGCRQYHLRPSSVGTDSDLLLLDNRNYFQYTICISGRCSGHLPSLKRFLLLLMAAWPLFHPDRPIHKY